MVFRKSELSGGYAMQWSSAVELNCMLEELECFSFSCFRAQITCDTLDHNSLRSICLTPIASQVFPQRPSNVLRIVQSIQDRYLQHSIVAFPIHHHGFPLYFTWTAVTKSDKLETIKSVMNDISANTKKFQRNTYRCTVHVGGHLSVECP